MIFAGTGKGVMTFPGFLLQSPIGGGMPKCMKSDAWIYLSCRVRMTSAAPVHCAPVNVARFRFSAIFWDRATSRTPVVAEKCRKTQFRGME